MLQLNYAINRNIINKGDASIRGWENLSISPVDFLEFVTNQGFTFCGTIKDNHSGKKPSASDIKAIQILAVDIDNKIKLKGKDMTKSEVEGYLSLQDALNDEFIKQYAFAIYTTPSHSEEHNRYRILFVCDSEITDMQFYKKVIQYLISHFGGDIACSNYDRMFFGNTNAHVFKINNIIQKDYLDRLVINHLEVSENNTKYSNYIPSISEVKEMLAFIPPILENHEWFSIVSAVANTYELELAVKFIDEWSPDVKQGTRYKVLHSSKSYSIGTVIYYAKKYGWQVDIQQKLTVKQDVNKPTELTIADAFTDKYKDKLKFNHTDEKWYIWDGKRWKKDDKKQIMQLIKIFIQNTGTNKTRSFETKVHLEAILSLSKSNPNISSRNGDFDKDNYLVNLKNGTFNLRTNLLQPHNPNDVITKMIDICYNSKSQCTNYEKFLATIFDNNIELIKFIQRILGLSHCGDNLEAKIFFSYGSGKNGKTVFFKVLQMIFGDYYVKSPTEMILAKKFDGIPNDIAMLPGKRLCVIGEMPENKSFSEEKIKDLTGGDETTGRFLRQEFFSFTPTHTIWIYGNHKPRIRGTDFGIWRRLCLIPFLVTIEDKDVIPMPELLARFEKEKSGILNWIIEGWKSYQLIGLSEPDIVKHASDIYRQEQDIVLQYTNDRCEISDTSSIKAADLFRDYNVWCKDNNEHPYTNQKFYKRIVEIPGVEEIIERNHKFISGIKLMENLQ